MRNSPQKITCALDLFYNGVSTRKVQQHFKAFYPHNSSWVSIYSWILKYAKHISKFTDKLKLQVGREVQVDEVEYHRRKSSKARLGIEENWFIDSVDVETRFMVASNYYKRRSQKEIKEIVKVIKEKSDNHFKIITTDALTQYEGIIRKVFGYYALKRGEGFNHPIERLHNSLRARTKTFRGFHGSIKTARAILKGFEIFYNFINKHQGINCCPYELAIPELKDKLNVPNKWLALIELANKSI
jgi:transposase-like protein